MESVYERFLCGYEKKELQEKELFFVFLDVPEYWEIQVYGLNGKIVNMGKNVAYIYFSEPIEKRNVSCVKWIRENGTIYKEEYYNKYGFMYCTHDLDESEAVMMKTYYTSEHQEVFQVNCSNGVVTLFENGMVARMFSSEEEFQSYALEH